jgi:L-ascorbate metabolism protein UlaG (beta-lactamase superfamily)
MTITLEWLGCATFRLTIDSLVVLLDTFVDRISTAPDVGITSDKITEADFALIGHSHWDHLAGADVIAKHTGARVIGSHESARVLRERGVPDAQLLLAQGGERFRLSPDVTVRVYPSLHSCIWSRAAPAGTVLTGDLGVTEDERTARLATGRRNRAQNTTQAAREMQEMLASVATSDNTGGALDYLIETPEGTILFQDSMGYWTGVYAGLRPDVAVLAAAGRGNIDGEPVQGAMEDFVLRECDLLRPRHVVFSHHDNFAGTPDVPDIADISPVRDAMARVFPHVNVITMDLRESVSLLQR